MRAGKGSLWAPTGRHEMGGRRIWAGLALIGMALLALLVTTVSRWDGRRAGSLRWVAAAIASTVAFVAWACAFAGTAVADSPL